MIKLPWFETICSTVFAAAVTASHRSMIANFLSKESEVRLGAAVLPKVIEEATIKQLHGTFATLVQNSCSA